MTDEITKLPVKFKEPPTGERTLELAEGPGVCNHSFYFERDPKGGLGSTMKHVTYVVDQAATEVECGHCRAKLNPTWVLVQLAHKESRYQETAKRYHEEMKRLNERSRTECQHCGKMTKISRR